MFEFRLPDVGEGIHEAELLEWLVEVGASIDEGTPVATVNTDKVSVELPSPRAGIVSSLPWEPGDVLEVGEVLMVLDVPGDAAADHGAPNGPGATRTSVAVADAPPAASPLGPAALLGRPVASPSTRKLASELGVALAGVVGSGPGGRILRSDVSAAAERASTSVVDVRADEVVREPLAGSRGAMFRHMSESSSVLATTTSTFTVRMERVEALIGELQGEGDEPAQPGIGVLSVTAACVVGALLANPRFNATSDPETNDLCLHRQVHLGIAVASPAGLLVPVLRAAQGMRLREIGDGIKRLAEQARSGSLRADDLRGGTFTLSSTGGLERSRVTSTQPIINLPQVAILWMSRVRDEAVVDHGEIRPGRTMACSLSFDHRYIDGAEATKFINDLTDLIEHPIRVLS